MCLREWIVRFSMAAAEFFRSSSPHLIIVHFILLALSSVTMWLNWLVGICHPPALFKLLCLFELIFVTPSDQYFSVSGKALISLRPPIHHLVCALVHSYCLRGVLVLSCCSCSCLPAPLPEFFFPVHPPAPPVRGDDPYPLPPHMLTCPRKKFRVPDHDQCHLVKRATWLSRLPN